MFSVQSQQITPFFTIQMYAVYATIMNETAPTWKMGVTSYDICALCMDIGHGKLSSLKIDQDDDPKWAHSLKIKLQDAQLN